MFTGLVKDFGNMDNNMIAFAKLKLSIQDKTFIWDDEIPKIKELYDIAISTKISSQELIEASIFFTLAMYLIEDDTSKEEVKSFLTLYANEIFTDMEDDRIEYYVEMTLNLIEVLTIIRNPNEDLCNDIQMIYNRINEDYHDDLITITLYRYMLNAFNIFPANTFDSEFIMDLVNKLEHIDSDRKSIIESFILDIDTYPRKDINTNYGESEDEADE